MKIQNNKIEQVAVPENCDDKTKQCAITDNKDNDNSKIKDVKQEGGEHRRGIVLGKTAKGIICAFLWPLILATSRICVQALENKVEHLTLNGFRYLVPAIGFGIFLTISGQTLKVKRENIKALVVYSIVLNLASLTTYIPGVNQVRFSFCTFLCQASRQR